VLKGCSFKQGAFWLWRLPLLLLIVASAASSPRLAAQTPVVSISNASVTEGNTGSVLAVFTVSLSEAGTNTVSVNFSTSNGTAQGNTDYQPTNGVLTLPAGVTSTNVGVEVFGDTAVEASETFELTLSTLLMPHWGLRSGPGQLLMTMDCQRFPLVTQPLAREIQDTWWPTFP
jgi:hypothetical protein